MLELRQTLEFERWLRGLRDRQGRARILDRIERIRSGNMGDVVILLLIGGDKDSQLRDIATAKALLSREEREDGDEGV